MTLGEKIKFIRSLRGLTQKELGLRVGFSASTADNRIRQYEIGKMKPKDIILERIADELDVPVEILNDIDINQSNTNALLYLFFELERTSGLKISKQDGQFVLYFDRNNIQGECYSEGLSNWYNAREKFFPTEESLNDDNILHDYRIWTQEYPKNAQNEAIELSNQVRMIHSGIIESTRKSFSIQKGTELVQIFVDMLQCGIHLDIRDIPVSFVKSAMCIRIRLSHRELLELDTDAAKKYSCFLSLIDFLIAHKQKLSFATGNYNTDSYDEYLIYSAPIATALLEIDKLQKQIMDGSFLEEDNQMEYDMTLNSFNIPIEQMITI